MIVVQVMALFDVRSQIAVTNVMSVWGRVNLLALN